MVFDDLENFFASGEEKVFFGGFGGIVDLCFDSLRLLEHVLEHEFDKFSGVGLIEESVIGGFFLLEEFFDREKPIEMIAVFGENGLEKKSADTAIAV